MFCLTDFYYLALLDINKATIFARPFVYNFNKALLFLVTVCLYQQVVRKGTYFLRVCYLTQSLYKCAKVQYKQKG
jgi:hypothetical protein